MTIDPHVTDLLPAYTLDCLDEDEIIQVTSHLAACERCQAELRAYQATADQLALAAPEVEPPARVKQALMERVQAAQRGALHAEQAGKPLSPLVSFFRRAAAAWSVASLALVAVLLASNMLLWRQVNQLAARPASLQVVSLAGTENAPVATGLIVLSIDGEHGTLVVDRLPQLSEEQQYQLWLIKDQQRTDGGVFSVSKDGYGSLWVNSPEPLEQYSSFGVTVEPQGGSPQPTGVRILAGSF